MCWGGEGTPAGQQNPDFAKTNVRAGEFQMHGPENAQLGLQVEARTDYEVEILGLKLKDTNLIAYSVNTCDKDKVPRFQSYGDHATWNELITDPYQNIGAPTRIIETSAFFTIHAIAPTTEYVLCWFHDPNIEGSQAVNVGELAAYGPSARVPKFAVAGRYFLISQGGILEFTNIIMIVDMKDDCNAPEFGLGNRIACDDPSRPPGADDTYCYLKPNNWGIDEGDLEYGHCDNHEGALRIHDTTGKQKICWWRHEYRTVAVEVGLLYIDGPQVDGTQYGNLERNHVNSSTAVTGIQEQETTVNVIFDIHVPGYGLQETDYYHAVLTQQHVVEVLKSEIATMTYGFAGAELGLKEASWDPENRFLGYNLRHVNDIPVRTVNDVMDAIYSLPDDAKVELHNLDFRFKIQIFLRPQS